MSEALRLGQIIVPGRQANRDATAQLNAIRFAAEYGFGGPPKGEEDLAKLLEPMVQARLHEYLAAAEAAIAAETREGAITVTASEAGAEQAEPSDDGIEKP